LTYERELIEAALADSNGKVAGPNGAAAKFGIPRSTLDVKIKQYPCSFLIYSEAFGALPKPALDYFYRRLWDVLTGKDQDKIFATLTRSDREAILSILRQTMVDLPDYWQASEP
jgi:Bacterial regulatory protein, Fis family